MRPYTLTRTISKYCKYYDIYMATNVEHPGNSVSQAIINRGREFLNVASDSLAYNKKIRNEHILKFSANTGKLNF